MKKVQKQLKTIKKSIDFFNDKKKEILLFDSKEDLNSPIPEYLIKPKTISKSYPDTFGVTVARNNIFCALTNTINGNILLKKNSGDYKIKVSKKTLRFYVNRIIYLFLKEKYIRKNFIKTKNNFLLDIKAPSRLKIKILKQIISSSLKRGVIIKSKPLKCFNGCKVSKARRKKRKGFRIFK
jgi:hypothetical protein